MVRFRIGIVFVVALVTMFAISGSFTRTGMLVRVQPCAIPPTNIVHHAELQPATLRARMCLAVVRNLLDRKGLRSDRREEYAKSISLLEGRITLLQENVRGLDRKTSPSVLKRYHEEIVDIFKKSRKIYDELSVQESREDSNNRDGAVANGHDAVEKTKKVTEEHFDNACNVIIVRDTDLQETVQALKLCAKSLRHDAKKVSKTDSQELKDVEKGLLRLEQSLRTLQNLQPSERTQYRTRVYELSQRLKRIVQARSATAPMPADVLVSEVIPHPTSPPVVSPAVEEPSPNALSPPPVPQPVQTLPEQQESTSTVETVALVDTKLPVMRRLPNDAIKTPEIEPPEKGVLPVIVIPTFDTPTKQTEVVPQLQAAPRDKVRETVKPVEDSAPLEPLPQPPPKVFNALDESLMLFIWFLTWPMLWPLLAIIVIIFYLLYIQGFLDASIQFTTNLCMSVISKLFGLKK